MSQGQPLNNLANAGYEQTGPINPEQEAMANNHVLSMMPTGGYQPATSAAGTAPSTANAAQTRAQQEQLIGTLGAGAAGMGPNAGLVTLNQGTDAATKQAAALSAAAAASGAGGAGAARYNAANAAGNATQAAGATAAELTAGTQQADLAALGGVESGVAGQDLSQEGVGLTQEQIAAQNQQFNAGAQNTESQFGAQEQAGQAQLANEMNQGQFAQEYGLEQAQNAAVAASEGQHEQNQQGMEMAGIGGATGGLSAGLSLLAKGKVIRGPHEVVAGERGLEADVRVPPQDLPGGTRKVAGIPRLADGGMVGIGGITPPSPDYSSRIQALQQMTADTIGKIRATGSAPSQASAQPIGQSQSFSPIPSSLRARKPIAAPAAGGLAPGVDTTQLAPMAGTAPIQEAPAAHGRLLTHATVLEAGEKGPEAIIPVKKDGEADMARAKDPGVRELIQDHPQFRHPLSADASEGNDIGDRLAKLKADVAQLEKLHKSTKRAA